jgi:hypothetical protein
LLGRTAANLKSAQIAKIVAPIPNAIMNNWTLTLLSVGRAVSAPFPRKGDRTFFPGLPSPKRKRLGRGYGRRELLRGAAALLTPPKGSCFYLLSGSVPPRKYEVTERTTPHTYEQPVDLQDRAQGGAGQTRRLCRPHCSATEESRLVEVAIVEG